MEKNETKVKKNLQFIIATFSLVQKSLKRV